MKSLLIIIVLSLSFCSSYGQNLSGRIQDYENGVLLGNVIIRNLNHLHIGTTSDAEGRYIVSATRGDSLQFDLLGYKSRVLVYNGENEFWFENVMLTPESMILDTIMVHRERTKYEKDSIEKRQLYDKVLLYQPPKTKFPKLKDLEAGQPLKITGPISGLLGKKFRKSKESKAFQEMYSRDESQAFIDSRYTSALVTQLTGMTGEDVYRFMQAYPMSYAYARQASNLEVMMWIKFNYKEWIQKKP
jgi:hypothetical protein